MHYICFKKQNKKKEKKKWDAFFWYVCGYVSAASSSQWHQGSVQDHCLGDASIQALHIVHVTIRS
jgi:hypothetical protein